ncbi:MAG: hypothetical protein AAGA66_04885 [Bacteroidota bacterium]
MLFSLVRSLIGLFTKGGYRKYDRIATVSAVMMMRIQFIIGLLLYVAYSPFTNRFTFTMSDPYQRFWSVEHLALMILAIGAAEIAGSKSKKSNNSLVKFKFQAIFFGISLLLILIGIPWSRLG